MAENPSESPDAGPSPEEIDTARRLFAGPCDFFWGATSIQNLPPITLPEVAFVGRSNVGKSSLINAITGRRTLARVSQTPGRTREINFFNLGEQLVLADLPGYGFAKASKKLASDWQKMIFAYLRGRSSLRRVVLLIDSRRGLGEVDRAVMEMLDKAAVSYLITLTKADQLDKADLVKVSEAITVASKGFIAAYPEVFVTSSRGKMGLTELQLHLASLRLS